MATKKINNHLGPSFLLGAAAIGLMLFVLISTTAPFQERLFSSLYPKSPSDAASPKNTIESKIVLNQTNPKLGDSINFTTAYPRQTKNPRIDVICYQGDTLVYGEAGSADHDFVLGGYASEWVRRGGAASCVARLFDLIWNGNNPQVVIVLATTSFAASGK